MADKLGFLDSLFDVNGDGKVDDVDFMDDLAVFHMIQEDKKTAGFSKCDNELMPDEVEEEREEKREQMIELGLDPDDYTDDELDQLDSFDIELLVEEEEEE